MFSTEDYVRLSMEYNLFWARIMREHAIFIESAMPPLQRGLARRADEFKQQYDRLLSQTIRLAEGVISKGALQAGQYVTRFTEAAEQAAGQLTGIEINGAPTRMEYNLEPYRSGTPAAGKEQPVSLLNQSIITLTNQFARFKSDLHQSQVSCRIFTFLYTAELSHVLQEALKYLEILNALQKRDEKVNQNFREFWNRNMADHAKSMRGLFDPTEVHDFDEANRFAGLFDAMPGEEEALIGARALSEFKADTAQGLIECRVKARMSALYADHLLRETNHYIDLLQS